MAARRSESNSGVLVRGEAPLIGFVVEGGDAESIRYFTSEESAEAAMSAEATQAAMDLAGAWRDFDWPSMESELHRIRHESSPSLPISF